jgi:hypothetical protein
MNILKSATKIVLLALVFALIALTAFKITDSETFKTVILMVVSFYFGQKSNPTNTPSVVE